MLLKLFLLFTLVPVIELYLLIKIGVVIGPVLTIAIVIITGIVGAWLAKHQGIVVLRRLQNELTEGRPPGNSIVDGVLVLTAGILLLTPGLLTDGCGIMLLLPYSRGLIRKYIKTKLKRKLDSGHVLIRKL